MSLQMPGCQTITLLREHPECLADAAAWFSSKWGIPIEAYRESMAACLAGQAAIPQWYFIQNGEQGILAGCGVIENDFHERKDLAPNLCALYVEEGFRGQGIAGQLLGFVCRDMAQFGLSRLYLVTDHTSFYERYGWSFETMVKGDDGCLSRLYTRSLSS